MNNSELAEVAKEYLINLIVKVTKLPKETILPNLAFENFGIDSVMILNLNKILEKDFGQVSKTLFFEYENLNGLTKYFVDKYGDKLEELSNKNQKQETKAQKVVEEKTVKPAKRRFVQNKNTRFTKPTISNETVTKETANKTHDVEKEEQRIAIVGVAGRYSKSESIPELWKNLKAGEDCIIEIPEDRWDYHDFYDKDINRKDKVYTKWGGFIKDVDKFDPMFFHMSPRESIMSDPAERIFLETSWQAFEDAGYSKSQLNNSRTGVFVGVMYGQYQMYVNNIDRNDLAPTSSYASVANRVSYFFNLHGPSMSVDTMCSSSLTAFHLAYESIKRGECDQALVGGVNVCIHPAKYIILSQQRYASSDGKCRTFGEGGDGYVPGEGVGAILLKPLEQAKKDRDQIYAVVTASSINHGGKTNGYTVPNPNAQGDLIADAIEKAGITPEAISCIEAHGTGTALGDPIEIAGLIKAFEPKDKKRNHCSIGSIKSNIGHCEAAAGVAAITKVLLEMKYKTLVPSIHSDELNQNIDFENSPFYVQHETKPWERPVIDGQESKRYAGISAFGAGGNNVHIILEEYEKQPEQVEEEKEYLIVLSDFEEDRLFKKAQQLHDAILSATGEDKEQMSLQNIAFTLQMGREEMEVRTAFTATTLNQLVKKLEQLGKGEKTGVAFYNAAQNMRNIESLLAQKDKITQLEDAVKKEELQKIAERWVQGYPVDWNVLNQNSSAHKISLPAYSFKKERYWVNVKRTAMDLLLNENSGSDSLSYFIDKNVSTIFQQQYEKKFASNDFIIKEHKVSGKTIVAGAVLVETAREAGTLACGESITQLHNIMWARPVELAGNTANVVVKIDEDEEELIYHICSGDENPIIYSQGSMLRPWEQEEEETFEQFSIEEIKSRLSSIHTREEVNKEFERIGFGYGESYQLIDTLYCGEWEAVSEMKIPSSLMERGEEILLKPSIIDCAFRTALGIKEELFSKEAQLAIPYELEKISIRKPIPQECYVYACIPEEEKAKWGEFVKSNIYILDKNGETVVSVTGFCARKLNKKKQQTNSELVYYYEKWVEEQTSQNSSEGRNILLLCDDDELIEAFTQDMKNQYTVLKQGEKTKEGIEQFLDNTSDDLYVLNFWNYKDSLADLYEDAEEEALSNCVRTIMDSGYYQAIDLLKTVTAEKMQNKVHYILAAQEGTYSNLPLKTMLIGAGKSMTPVNNRFFVKYVQMGKELSAQKVSEAVEHIIDSFDSLGEEIKVEEDALLSRKIDRMEDEQAVEPVTLKQEGVYLITGGLGGLGYLFASYITKNYQSELILCGHSELTKDRQEKVEALIEQGAKVTYEKCDVANLEEMQTLFGKHKNITGIIHCAGVMKELSILDASREDMESIFASKLQGSMYLDKASKDCKLDFFLAFSSISSIVGDFGICSYGAANKFLDSFIRLREELRSKGLRNGKSICINWPMWNEGGMSLLDGDIAVMYHEYSGMEGLDQESGLIAFERVLSAEKNNVIVLLGNKDKMDKALKLKKPERIQDTSNQEIKESVVRKTAPCRQDDRHLAGKTANYLRKVLAKALSTEPERIKTDEDLERYGMDSIVIMDMSALLEADFGTVPKTLFFEYKTVDEVVEYFLHNHKERLQEMFPEEKAGEIKEKTVSLKAESVKKQIPQKKYSALSSSKQAVKQQYIEDKDDIAIIGISARFPEAEDIEQFWDNLKAGKDCIKEIPEERWDYRKYYSQDRKKKGSIYSKWGGFISDADKFDPIFFNIAPREAENMDPQERIFLETAYHAVEDAGYTREQLAGKKVGVFAAAMYAHYQLLGMDEERKGNFVMPQSFFSSIANRVSYFMNFTGPSLTLDTACSSSLETIRQACVNIRAKECDMAIAGGVNLSLHPRKYQFLCAASFLSTDGRCRSFGKDGDGYVPGEGVGAVMLKSLKKAKEDGDYIYGVIKGYSTNHGGKTNGYSVPNPVAQAEVAIDALEKSKIPYETISYIECHGTGTALGDPIEIRGLNKVFEHTQFPDNICRIGSVKSNIGHLEASAGVSGVIKILLQMQHKKLVASLHADELNPFIPFDQIPFQVQKQCEEWSRVEISDGTKHVKVPRRSLISSFGAGGTNVSLVLEEYENDRNESQSASHDNVIVLSAKTKEQVKKYAQTLANYIEKVCQEGERSYVTLSNIAYTLQNGREAMEERMAFCAKSLEEAVEILRKFSNDEETGKKVYCGNINKDSDYRAEFFEDSDGDEYIRQLIQGGKYEKLAKCWAIGVKIPWKEVPGQGVGKTIPLPGYPFKKDRYWIKEVQESEGTNQEVNYETDEAVKSEIVYYESVWKAYEASIQDGLQPKNTLIISEDSSVYDAASLGVEHAVFVQNAQVLNRIDENHFELNIENEQDLQTLFGILQAEGRMPEYCVVADIDNRKNDKACVHFIYSLIHALNAMKIKDKIKLAFVYEEQDWPTVSAAAEGYSISVGKVMRNMEILHLSKEPSKNQIMLDANIIRTAWSALSSGVKVLKMENGVFYSKGYQKITDRMEPSKEVLKDKVWLITGGFGNLGQITAKHLCRKYGAKIALLGRTQLNEKLSNQLEKLRENKVDASYFSADISNPESVRLAISRIKEVYGRIDGVIHAAGVYNNQLVTQKEYSMMEDMLKPKVEGSMILDRELEKESVEYFVMYSSLSAVLGDFGQCDYSMGNCYLSHFAAAREKMHKAGLRTGKTIAINWPLWLEGGMHGTSGAEELYLKTSGMNYLDTEDGMKALDCILASNHSEVTVLCGEPDRIDKIFNLDKGRENRKNRSKTVKAANKQVVKKSVVDVDIRLLLTEELKTYAAEIIHFDKESIEENENFGNYGFDSLSLKEFAEQMEERFGIEVEPTLFYNYSNLNDLVNYLLKEYKDKMEEVYTTVTEVAEADTDTEKQQEQQQEQQEEEVDTVKAEKESSTAYCEDEKIAIIGADGVFPQSQNLEEFWEKLKNETDMVTEIPKDRWDLEEMFDPDPEAKNKSVSKWGGFISDVDKFDAAFFSISPKEAELMDPQQRLFLQSAWKTIEDAGYKASSLSGKQVGVFAGAQFNDYQNMLWEQLHEPRVQMPVGNMLSIISNRVSYLLNLKGPSEVVNTACSSSLVAIHRAVEAIRHGECDMAIAGGVSLSLSSDNYIAASKLGILSPDGKCKTFDKDANGFVKGEGVGCVLLKSYKKAIEDHDNIYAVIQGSCEKHGGKAASITAPNAPAQTELLLTAYEKAGIPIDTINYVETHGTGTELGDPIEVDGLKAAFGEGKRKGSYCGIGSVKSNVGHLEPAAGIVSVMKVLMSMKYEMLPASIHFHQINPYLKIENSPFYIVDKTKKWEHLKDSDGKVIPLRAGISAFGFGGTNTHIIVEKPMLNQEPGQAKTNELVFPFSARNKKRLENYLQNYLDFLSRKQVSQEAGNSLGRNVSMEELCTIAADILHMDKDALDPMDNLRDAGFEPYMLNELVSRIEQQYETTLDVSEVMSAGNLHSIYEMMKGDMEPTGEIQYIEPVSKEDLAFTLQNGREAMNERIAFVASSVEELNHLIESYLRGQEDNRIFTCNVRKQKISAAELREMEQELQNRIAGRQYDAKQTAEYWTKGALVDWNALYESTPYKVSLPTYPFEKNRFWIPEKELDMEEVMKQLLEGKITVDEADELIKQLN